MKGRMPRVIVASLFALLVSVKHSCGFPANQILANAAIIEYENPDATAVPRCENAINNYDFSKSNYEIGSNFTEDPGETCLNFENNAIHKVSSDAFDSCPNLAYLNLAYNNFNLGEFLKNLTHEKLSTLVLDCKAEICRSRQSGGLMTLRLNSDLPGLQRLYLRGRRLFGINSPSGGRNLPSLSHLYLSDNFLHKDSFAWLPRSLNYLNLSNNQLKTLTLTNLPSLKYLIAAGNCITTVDSKSLNGLDALRVLDMSSNSIDVIEDGLFDGMRQLHDLHLENNRLEKFPAVNVDLGLRHASLDSNRFEVISEKMFARMPHLKILYLHDNQISHVHELAFANLKELEVLSLANNRLASLPIGWSLPLLSLKNLDLERNQLTKLNDISLTNRTTPLTLYLRGNPRFVLDVHEYDSLPQGTKIIVDGHPRIED